MQKDPPPPAITRDALETLSSAALATASNTVSNNHPFIFYASAQSIMQDEQQAMEEDKASVQFVS